MKSMRWLAAALLTAACGGAWAEASGPKNVILMIADGMGHAHVEAASLYRFGERRGQLYWDFVYLPMSTYSTNNRQGYDPEQAWADFNWFRRVPADSAATATALGAGIKTRNGAIGQDAEGNDVDTVYDDAKAMGKSAGVLATVRFNHATPAVFIAKVTHRRMDQLISRQMILESAADVIIGPGHPWYDDDGQRVEEPNYTHVVDEATWEGLQAGTVGADTTGDGEGNPWTLIERNSDFQRLAEGAGPMPERLLGVVRAGATLQSNRSGDRKAPPYAVPLTEDMPDMTTLMRAALNVLNQNPKGFFLMGEGGAVDWASHANDPGRMIEEQIDFDKAVEAAAAWVEEHSSWDETLLIVTADHECGYLVGPGSDPEWKPLEDRGKGEMPGMEFKSMGHTNQLVPLFAKGVGAELFLERIHGEDPRLGKYTDNTEVARVIRAVWR